MEMQGIEQGLEQGRILGIKEEKIRSLKKLLLLRYHEVNDLWIESLNENQLDQFQELLFEIEDYQEFYDRINQIK